MIASETPSSTRQEELVSPTLTGHHAGRSTLRSAGAWIFASATAAAAALGVVFVAMGADVAATIPAIELPNKPLFGNQQTEKSSLVLALSVEYPTAGALYTSPNAYADEDSSYANTKEYIGYFDAESCYKYNNSPSEVIPAGQTKADFKRFDRIGPAEQRKCSDAFSGNFLNWATGSAVDMLRMALTGGDRSVDTPSLTILQRAFIPNGDPMCAWNTSTFPAKKLVRDGGGAGTYWGAVPAILIKEAGGSDIWVGNTLNRVFFGKAKGGGCDNPWSYNLGGTLAPRAMGPKESKPQPTSPPPDAVACAVEGGTCPSGDVQELWYGADTRWVVAPTIGDALCSHTVFGDPAPYASKRCYARPYSGTWTPPLPTLGPIEQRSNALPADAVDCSGENGSCAFSGLQELWYGADTQWKVAPAVGPASCNFRIYGDPAPGVAKRCYVRPYSGVWKPDASTSGSLNTDGFFYARVQVCEKSGGSLVDVRDYGLCRQYPNGNYKPIGAIQKYASDLRLAAFGYLLENTSSAGGGRYGGVLRAPMKFVGARTFDIAGKDNTPPSGNPAAEWDASTGVFHPNPDNDTTQSPPTSGVINYLNKFGRTGPVPGRYKRYDPVGELHYEALRYLQGVPPSPAAVANVTASMADGFPYASSWVDPFGGDRSAMSDYSCVRTGIVTIGDIHTWDGGRLPTPDAANNIPDIAYWRDMVAAFETNLTKTYIDGQGRSRTTGNPNGANHGVPSAYQVLGASYWSHTHDIRGKNWTNAPDKQRPGLRVKNYFFDVNTYGAQNDVSARRYKNQFFMAAKYGSFESDPSAGPSRPFNTYGNPFRREDGTPDNNVWQDPANPGEARNYYLQSDARGVLRAFDMTLRDASASARSIAGTAISNKNFTQVGSTIFQGAFDLSDWSGDVLSLPVSVSSSFDVTVGAKPEWSAADRLGTLPTPAASRNIVVGRTGATAQPMASNFSWEDIDGTLKAQLSRPGPAAAADIYGQDRLNYLRGDRSKEGTLFRQRARLLGDIINSGVAYSGAPTTSLGGEPGYAQFHSKAAARTHAVFVGANDGMLHAFHAKTGDELFGYIPSWMGPELSALAHPGYDHRSYVDAPPVVAEADIGASSPKWKTVLVSGTGAGGRGVFALDVTDPAAFTAASVMWEFTQADDADMGYVMGKPQIVKMRVSAPGAAPKYRWFAAVASGVNNYVADSAGIRSTTGRPALFLLALDKESGAAWSNSGSRPNYYKISLPVDSALSAKHATGMINFGVAYGPAREVAQIYAGDLHGNLWKLDFSRVAATDWSMDKLSGFKNGAAPIPLYSARSAKGDVQPITMAPSLVAGPAVKGKNTVLVAFGTGKFIETADKSAAQKDTLYVIHDNADSTPDIDSASGAVIGGRGRLAVGSIDSAGKVTVPAFVWGRAASDDDASQRSGWYADFTALGERQISNAIVTGDSLIFGSTIPGTASAGCAGAGSGREYLINIDTGQGASRDSDVGLMGEPVVATVSEATSYTTSSTTGRRTQTTTQQVLQQGSAGVKTSTRITSTVTAGRLSWRQVNNYQDLKASP